MKVTYEGRRVLLDEKMKVSWVRKTLELRFLGQNKEYSGAL